MGTGSTSRMTTIVQSSWRREHEGTRVLGAVAAVRVGGISTPGEEVHRCPSTRGGDGVGDLPVKIYSGGGSVRRTCSKCGGTGKVEDSIPGAYGLIPVDKVCPKCGGEGRVEE